MMLTLIRKCICLCVTFLAATLLTAAPSLAQEKQILEYPGFHSPVPRAVGVFALAHEKYGNLVWANVVAHAIAPSPDCFALSPDEAFVFGWSKERLSNSIAAKSIFTRQMVRFTVDEMIKQPT